MPSRRAAAPVRSRRRRRGRNWPTGWRSRSPRRSASRRSRWKCRWADSRERLAARRGVGRFLSSLQGRRNIASAQEHLVEIRFEDLISGGEAGASRRIDARSVQHREERHNVDLLRGPVVEVHRLGRPHCGNGAAMPAHVLVTFGRCPSKPAPGAPRQGAWTPELPAAAMPLVTVTRPLGPCGSIATPHRKTAWSATAARL